ncbi:hypothetical protein E4T44_09906 [Aureobasidium sp. EXF-8845]|nr:hypothetical protein E4T44_09906 [Aureobasidium sp. EXF-8845]KAI4838083.1 hypothetical protein E4T45_09758 [Aureobasidium sp. EXF-8846]
MADANPAGKSPPAATVEDCADSDDEKGDSSASKPASNSASKRSHKTSKTRPSSNVGPPEAPPPPQVKDAPTQPPKDYTTRAGSKDEIKAT